MSSQETLLNDRYRLIAQQGSGGMAVIYKAQDLALGRTVAVKILRPSLTNDPEFLKRFRQEARNVANLSHPNIVTVHDVGQDGNTHYIVMEYIDGDDLKRLIRAGAPFSIDRALSIAIKICAGVGYAHRAGLVHADVKPQNVLVTENDKVKVTDFGIAQALSATQPLERQRIVWGSPHYFSPEQAQGEPPTPAADVYAIGIVLFEMLTGRLPFVGADQQELALAHIRETPPHASDLNPNVPVHLDRILDKVLSKEPGARYRTADQLGRILISYRRQGHTATDEIPRVPDRLPPADTAATLPPTPPPSALPGGYGAAQSTVPAVMRAQAATEAPTSRTAGWSYPDGSRATAPVIPRAGEPPRPYQPPRAPDAMLQSRYRAAEPPQPLDLVTIVLAFLAFIAVVLLIPLWIAVYQAWAG
ncbi:MAG TPA: protein kinase [Aggregatilineaceae bacterium]|nr:protein kinase [Anaerolineae bacterium]HMM26951.1 protein kinase [Aggregatilineaceae bacterium]